MYRLISLLALSLVRAYPARNALRYTSRFPIPCANSYDLHDAVVYLFVVS